MTLQSEGKLDEDKKESMTSAISTRAYSCIAHEDLHVILRMMINTNDNESQFFYEYRQHFRVTGLQ